MRSRLRSTSCTPTMSGLAARMASPIFSRLTCSPPYQTLNVMTRSVTASSAVAAAASEAPAGHSNSASQARFIARRRYSGLRKRSVKRSLSPIARNLSRSTSPPCRVGGSDQTPFGWSGRVLRVGVDFALADQLEARFLDQRDRVILAHVAGLRFRVLGLVALRAVLDDAEDAARLERRVHGLEHRVGRVVAHPAVDVAEGEHHVDAAVRHRLQCVRRLQRGHGRAAVEVGSRRQLVGVLLEFFFT